MSLIFFSPTIPNITWKPGGMFFFFFKGMKKYHQTSPQKRRESADGIMLAVAQLYGRKMAFVGMRLWLHASPFLLFPSGRKSTAVETLHGWTQGNVVLVIQRTVGKKSRKKYFTCKWESFKMHLLYLFKYCQHQLRFTYFGSEWDHPLNYMEVSLFLYWKRYKHKLDVGVLTMSHSG